MKFRKVLAGLISVSVLLGTVTLSTITAAAGTTGEGYVWQPTISGVAVSDNEYVGQTGIQNAAKADTTLAVEGDSIKLTVNTGSYKALNVQVSGHGGTNYNCGSGFRPVAGIEYEVSFNASVASGSGQVRIRGNAKENNNWVSTDIDTTPKTITYTYTQSATGGNLQIDTGTNAINSILIISDIKIKGAYVWGPLNLTSTGAKKEGGSGAGKEQYLNSNVNSDQWGIEFYAATQDQATWTLESDGLHLKNASGQTFKTLEIKTTGTNYRNVAGFYPLVGTQYQLSFDAKLASGTGNIRVGHGTDWKDNIALTTDFTKVTYDFTFSTAGESIKIDTKTNTEAIIINNLQIEEVVNSVSTNADLSALSIGTGTLSPAFDKDTLSYTATVNNATSTLSISHTLDDSTAASILYAGATGTTAASNPANLAVGENIFRIVTTAEDGVTTKTYTLTITRLDAAYVASTVTSLSGLTISAGTLTPAFSSATKSYTASVSTHTTSMTVTPTVTDTGKAIVKVNGTVVTSGSASGAIDLNVGTNTITVVVTAEDGITTETYTITVTRAALGTITFPLNLTSTFANFVTNGSTDVMLNNEGATYAMNGNILVITPHQTTNPQRSGVAINKDIFEANKNYTITVVMSCSDANTALDTYQLGILPSGGGLTAKATAPLDSTAEKTLTWTFSKTDLSGGALFIRAIGGDHKGSYNIHSILIEESSAASTYTVSFNSNGGSAVANIANVTSGGKITAPAAPTKSGYTFVGWYKESALTNAWSFASDAVTANITLYAKWTENNNNNDNNNNNGGGSTTPPTTTSTDKDGNTTTSKTETTTDASGNTITKVTETIKVADSKDTIVIETVKTDSKTTAEVNVVVRDVNAKLYASGVSLIKTDIADVVALAEKALGKTEAVINVTLNDSTLLSRVNNDKVNEVQIVIEGANNDNVNVMVNAAVLNQAKELGKTVKLALRDEKGVDVAVWSISPDGADETKAVSLSVSTAKATDNKGVSQALGNTKTTGTVISLGKNLPKAANISVKVDSVKAGEKVYIYKFNAKTGKFEETLQKTAAVSKSGSVSIKNAESENYVILTKAVDSKLVTPVTKQSVSSIKKSEIKVGKKAEITTIIPQGIDVVSKIDKNSKTPQVAITYKSSDTSVAKVNSSGAILYVGNGDVTITITKTYSNGKTSSSNLNFTV